MSDAENLVHHVFPGPQRKTGIRTYGLLLESILDGRSPIRLLRGGVSSAEIEGLAPGARVLVHLGCNEGEMQAFLVRARRARPDLRRTILMHDPPNFAHDKLDRLAFLGRSRFLRGVRRGVNRLLGARLDRLALQPGDRFLAMSRCGAEVLRNRLQSLGCGGSVGVVPHGLYQAHPGIHERPVRETLVVGYFGFISPSKGVSLLLDAIRILDADPQTRGLIRMRIAGIPDSPYAAEHFEKQKMEALRESGSVEFLDPCSDEELPAFLGDLDVLALPYLRPESVSASGPLHWGWTCGLPVVANHNPYFAEVLGGTGAGEVMVQPIPAEWARTLLTIARDRERLEHYRKGALECGRANSWSSVAARYHEVLLSGT